LLHEAFELDAAIRESDVALEGDDGFSSRGGGEPEAFIGQELLHVREKLGLELLMAGWIGVVAHAFRRSLKNRKIIARMHQVQPAIEMIA
jgi:hypothetical protein